MGASTTEPPPTYGIFLSYRRGDSAGSCGRLYDQLVARFGESRVFRDIDSMAPGVDFVDAVEQIMTSCDAVLVVIGPRWLSTTDSGGGRRLDDPNDLVRLEVEAALSGSHRVFPLTVDGAEMPRAAELPDSLAKLTRRNAIDLSERHWHQDVSYLISVIERAAPNLATRPDETFPDAQPLATDTNAAQPISPSRTQPAPGTPHKASATPYKVPGNLRAPLVVPGTRAPATDTKAAPSTGPSRTQPAPETLFKCRAVRRFRFHTNKNCEFEVNTIGVQFHDWDDVSRSFTIFRQQLPAVVKQDIWATGLDVYVQLFDGPHQFSFLNSDDKDKARAAIDRLLSR